MELRQYFNLLWKWAWLIVLAVAIAATSSFIASKAATPLYKTKTTLMIGRATQNPDPNNVDIYTSQQLAYTYIQLAQREPVLKGAIESLGLQMEWRSLAGQVSAVNVPQTQLLEITIVDSDPYRAKVLADAIAQQLIELSPGSAGNKNAEQDAFTTAQLDDLKKKIQESQEEVLRLNQELDAATSARQIQDLQTQISVLENKVSSWQNTYSQLLLTYEGGDVNTLSVIEEAEIPTGPFSPNVLNNVLVAAAIGLALAVVGAFLIEYLDDTVKTPSDVTRVTRLPSLVSIPFIEGEDYPDKLVAITDPLSPVVESFRQLRTNLQFSTLDRPLTSLMMTSPSPSEGKSVTMANLAVVLAQSGRKVVIVDTDLRRPTQHKLFGLPNRTGLTDALLEVISPNAETIRQSKDFRSTQRSVFGKEAISEDYHKADPIADLFTDMGPGKISIESPNPTPRSTRVGTQTIPAAAASHLDLSNYLQATQVDNLQLLSTGPLPPNPAELLGSELMAMLIHTLKAQADMVLFDSPPTLLFADAAVLSTRVDGVILINDMGRTRTNESVRAVEELRQVHANLLGIVLNRVGSRQGGYNYYYYYYYQDDEKGRRGSRSRNKFRLPFELPWVSRNNHHLPKNGKVLPPTSNHD